VKLKLFFILILCAFLMYVPFTSAVALEPGSTMHDILTLVDELSEEYGVSIRILSAEELSNLGLEIPTDYYESRIKLNKGQIEVIIREFIQHEIKETEHVKSLLPIDAEWFAAETSDIVPLVYMVSERPWQDYVPDGYGACGRSIVRGDVDPTTGIFTRVDELDYWVPAVLFTYNFMPNNMWWTPDPENQRIIVYAIGDIVHYVPEFPPIVLLYQGAQRLAYHGRQ